MILRAIFLFVSLSFCACSHRPAVQSNVETREPAYSSESAVHQLGSDPDVSVASFEFSSSTVQMNVPYWVMIPKNISGPIPVVYFLHGLGESHLWFQQLGGINVYKRYIAKGGKPFAIVAFSGRLGYHNFYWVDEAGDQGLPWATMLMDELLPEVERRFHLGESAQLRMIAGISMGAAGAFQLSMNFPGRFSCVAGHSIVLKDAASAVRDFPRQFGTLENFATKDPVELAKKNLAIDQKPFARAWIDIGGGETAARLQRAKEFREVLLNLGYPTETLDTGESDPLGGHDLKYWKKHLPNWVQWYGKCFQKD